MESQENILKKIPEVAYKFLSKKTIDEAYRTIVKESLSSYEGAEGSVLIAEGDELKRVYASYPLFYDIKVKRNDIRFKSYKTLIPLIVDRKEFKIDEKEYPFLKKLKIRSIILIPLSYALKQVGILVIWSKKRKPKMEEKPKILKLLGFIAHISIQKSKFQVEDTGESELILKKIYDATLRFLTPLSLEDTYKIVLYEAVKLISGENGRIFLEENGNLKNVYNSSSKMPLFNIRKRGNVFRSFSKNEAFIVHSNEIIRVYPKLRESNVRSIIYIPLSDHGRTYGVMTIRSKKDQQFSSQELSILKLFGSLANLAIRKVQLYANIKESLDTRDLFISLAAHELRTPLTTINGYVQLLLSKLNNGKPIQNKWVLELALESKRLNTLVEEFLEIERIKTGKLQFNWRECNLKNILSRAISNFKFNYPQRKLILHDSIKSKKNRIIGDPDKLIQVLTNVLENAQKYSEKDKKITITSQYNPPFFTVEVIDEGQGISEKDKPLIFKGFYKGKNSVHEGMGLGLYLAKNIINSHHGEIDIKSKLNAGTSVEIKLPKIE